MLYVVHNTSHQRSVSTGGTGSWAEKDGDSEYWGYVIKQENISVPDSQYFDFCPDDKNESAKASKTPRSWQIAD